jgi:hypothetical protein
MSSDQAKDKLLEFRNRIREDANLRKQFLADWRAVFSKYGVDIPTGDDELFPPITAAGGPSVTIYRDGPNTSRWIDSG